ncbi:MAG: IS66 family insertion sequence element accessory protein TnpB [Aeriscardovia sp.]|nr:IS66 family insertion sequence element accessory protein TnpB [Aeriscardovia sp.]
MLVDANPTQFKKIYLALGHTDLRMGIDGLASLVQFYFNNDPYEEGVLYIFKGRRSDRIKCLLYEGDGFLLLTKRVDKKKFRWPRRPNELKNITQEQFSYLMQGLEVEGL